MSRNYKFSPGEYYHIYNRGIEKRKIFLKNYDYDRFQFLLYLCNATEPAHVSNYQGLTLLDKFSLKRENILTDIGAYCLMPNHFHLLLKEKEEGGISKFIQKITTGYTMYFNKINERTGALFQGSFKAEPIDNDRHLKYIYSYINLNPLKIINNEWEENVNNKQESFLGSYRHSSYLDLKGEKRPENSILNTSVFPEYFSVPKDFDNFIKEWISIKNEQNESLSKVKPC